MTNNSTDKIKATSVQPVASDDNEVTPDYYSKYIKVKLSEEDIAKGYVIIKIDPYRIASLYNVEGGGREQILKKILRWVNKGHDEMKVINEIQQALNRLKEMAEESNKVIEIK